MMDQDGSLHIMTTWLVLLAVRRPFTIDGAFPYKKGLQKDNQEDSVLVVLQFGKAAEQRTEAMLSIHMSEMNSLAGLTD